MALQGRPATRAVQPPCPTLAPGATHPPSPPTPPATPLTRRTPPAGYRHNNEVPPSPPATRSLRDFRVGQAGRRRSDSEALLAMVGWANRQPLDAGGF